MHHCILQQVGSGNLGLNTLGKYAFKPVAALCYPY